MVVVAVRKKVKVVVDKDFLGKACDNAEVKRLKDQDLYRKEQSIQGAVMKYLKTQPGWWVKISDRFVAGIPDIIGCMYGRFFSIELKRPKGEKPTPLQFHNMELINKNGGDAIWVRSLPELKKAVEKWKKRKR